MAFAGANNSTTGHSTFIDDGYITHTTSGNEKALHRKGLEILLNAISSEASFDSQARHPSPRCHPSTRTGLLEHIFQWMDLGEEDILFLDGSAGTGKTSVAQTLAARCAEMGLLVTSYFFFRGSPSRNTITPLVPTIAYDIATSTPQMRNKMKKIINEDPSILDKSTDEQLRKLILDLYQPSLFRWKSTSKQKRSLLVIDGLDECIGDNDQRQVINLLGQLAKSKHFPIRCFITSRPEPHIISAIGSLPVSVARVTLNDETWDATQDIRTYFRSSFGEISSRLPPSVPRPWPSDAVLDVLVQRAGGVFVYASTVVKYVDDQDSSPVTQLEHVLEPSPGAAPFAELDRLYQQILTRCPSQNIQTLLHIFGFMLLRNPIYDEAYDVSLIEEILGLSRGKVGIVLRRLHSILAIENIGTKKTLRFLHASFGDFLFDRNRSGHFSINRHKESQFLSMKCIDYMGNREQRGQDSLSLLSRKRAIIYAWNSWSYHGIEAGELCFVDLITKLRHCDKSSWVKVFPEDYHKICADGLDAGITWLQHHSPGPPTEIVISDLMLVKGELEWNYCANILIDMNVPLTMLRLFEDPGIDFFDLEGDYLVVLDTTNKPLTALYFRCRGKTYNLAERGTSLPSNLFRRPQNKQGEQKHGFIAAHCIRSLKSSRNISNAGLRYAIKYWAKHVCLSDITDNNVLEELQLVGLRKTTPSREITVLDVTLVVQWLEKFPSSPQKAGLLLLWESHLLKLRSTTISLGIS